MNLCSHALRIALRRYLDTVSFLVHKKSSQQMPSRCCERLKLHFLSSTSFNLKLREVSKVEFSRRLKSCELRTDLDLVKLIHLHSQWSEGTQVANSKASWDNKLNDNYLLKNISYVYLFTLFYLWGNPCISCACIHMFMLFLNFDSFWIYERNIIKSKHLSLLTIQDS